MKQRRIIDNRKKEKFMIDDEYLNGMAKLCGWQGTIVYNSLCRHTNRDQECFPSINLMAEQHHVSRPTILKGIEALERRNIIDVSKKRSKGGKWLNNTYILLDKSGWDYSQVNVDDMVETPSNGMVTKSTPDTLPSQHGLPSQVNVTDSKETHGKETHDKETHPSKTSVLPVVQKDGLLINQVFQLFELVNPTIGQYYGNKTQRTACERLLAKWSLEEIAGWVAVLPELNANQYAKGKSITPWEMVKNMGFIKAFIDQKKKQKPSNFLKPEMGKYENIK